VSVSVSMWPLSWPWGTIWQEADDFPGRGAEARLAVGRDQLDVQHAAGLAARGSRRRPRVPVADALAALDAPRQQVAGEDRLDGLFQPGAEREPDGVGVLTGAEKGSPSAGRSSAGL